MLVPAGVFIYLLLASSPMRPSNWECRRSCPTKMSSFWGNLSDLVVRIQVRHIQQEKIPGRCNHDPAWDFSRRGHSVVPGGIQVLLVGLGHADGGGDQLCHLTLHQLEGERLEAAENFLLPPLTSLVDNLQAHKEQGHASAAWSQPYRPCPAHTTSDSSWAVWIHSI